MADLSFYTSRWGITSVDAALEKFVSALETYYDRNYYVDWNTVYANAGRYKRELLLLSSLCGEKDIEQAARTLLRDYPKVIAALPILIGNRGSVRIMDDPEQASVTIYDFGHPFPGQEEEVADRYAHFLATSGLIQLLERICSVPDYVTGVEVGIGTHGRKNRGGRCGIRAIEPFVNRAASAIPSLLCKKEAAFEFLCSKGCSIPPKFKGIRWDWAFWTQQGGLVVMEVNHYGVTGSKPSEIVRGYVARQSALREAGIGFIWVTDGLGWKQMMNPLRQAFSEIDYLVNIRLAKEGQLEWSLRKLLAP